MSRFFTWRRLFVYSAYFTGVFSLIIGLFISQQAWAIHKTVRLIEKSWDARGHNYSEYSWIDKATHALLAGHEDVSKYNDIFWAKYDELDMTDGIFVRANLKTCEPGYEPDWVTANAGYQKWGFVMYRTDYDEDDETWAKTVRHINHSIRAHLEIEATHDGAECDPELVRDRAVLEIIEDRETLNGADADTVRALWRKRVDDGLVDKSFKMGGWNWGWYRVNLSKGKSRGQDEGESKAEEEEENEEIPQANGLSLNLCLMYDWSARALMQLAQGGLPAGGPRDPWEPFLVAVDGMWNNGSYMYITSWAEGYSGTYAVALSILFNNFHARTFEREMERSSPYMWMGGPIVDLTAPWWQQIFQLLLSTTHAVARPGHFPFNDRWQELEWPFTREDSRWNKYDDAVLSKADDASPPGSKKLDYSSEWDRKLLYYKPCLDSDEDQEGCFQMGNFRVRKPDSRKSDVVPSAAESTTEEEEAVSTAASEHLEA